MATMLDAILKNGAGTIPLPIANALKWFGGVLALDGAEQPEPGQVLTALDSETGAWRDVPYPSYLRTSGEGGDERVFIATDPPLAGGYTLVTDPVDRFIARWQPQPVALPPLDLRRFASSLTALTFEGALHDAIEAIPDSPNGGTIIIPHAGEYGAWGLDDGIELCSMDYALGGSGIVGAVPGVILKWPASFSGRCVTIDGLKRYDGTVSEGFFAHGGLENLQLISDGGAATVLYLQGLLYTYFHRVTAGGALAPGGKGCVITNAQVSQNVDFHKCHFDGSDTGMIASSANTLGLHSCTFNQNRADNLVVDTVTVDLTGITMFQSPITHNGIRVTGDSTSHVTLRGQAFTEGPDNALVRIESSAVDTRKVIVDVSGVTVSGALAYVVDSHSLGAISDKVFIRDIVPLAAPPKLLRAVGGISHVEIHGHPGPREDPSLYEIDTVTRANTTATNRGIVESGWTSTAGSFEAMIAPYLVDAIDASKRALFALSGSDVVSGVGTKGGAIVPVFTGGEVQYVASSPYFNGRPVFTTTGKTLQITLPAPLAVGAHPGMIAVFRRPDATGTVNGPALYTAGSFISQLGIQIPGAAGIVGQWQDGTNRLIPSAVISGSKVHVVYVTQSRLTPVATGAFGLTIDRDAPIQYGGDSPPATSAITTGLLGDQGNYESPGVWFVNGEIPEGTVRQMMDALLERFGG